MSLVSDLEEESERGESLLQECWRVGETHLQTHP